MIRWYDYVMAVLAADLMLTLFLMGATSTDVWAIIGFGFLSGIIYRVWTDVYCNLRLIQEYKH